MRTSTRYLMGVLSLSASWLLLGGGCGASSKDTDGNRNTSGSSAGGSNGNPNVIDTDAGLPDAGPFIKLHPLCGNNEMDGSCLPDDPRTCSTFVPPAEPPSDNGGAGGETSEAGEAGGEGSLGGGNATGGTASNGGNAGHSGTASNGGNGGTSSTSGNGGASDGGVASAGGAFNGEGGALGTDGGARSTDGGAPGAGGAIDIVGGQGGQGPQTPISYACQVTRRNNRPARVCTAAGAGLANAPCFGAADCAPGLACVSDGDAGRCRPYCCDPETDCQAGAYCAERPLRKSPSDTTNVEPPRVPVCVPADDCSLEERFPCPIEGECRCKGDTACMVVRDDGSTACLEPGTGTQGDPCPCAWNHVCSKLTNQCVKLCRTDTTNDCGTQKCQASSELPKNFGICVGPT